MNKKVLIMCLISVIGISGCGKQPTTNFEAHFNEILLEGKTISFPCSYKELTDMGFQFSSSDLKRVGSHHLMRAYGSWKDSEWIPFDVCFSFMGESGSRQMEECELVEFAWLPERDRTIDITFYGGINADSTREDVARILEEEYADESNALYSKYLDPHHHKGIEVSFYGDQVSAINIDNSADYID